MLVYEAEPEPIVLQAGALSVPILFKMNIYWSSTNRPGMTVLPGAGVQTGTLVNALLHQVSNLSGIGGQLRCRNRSNIKRVAADPADAHHNEPSLSRSQR